MTEPLVTIGVTAFNAQDTIGRAIRSALAQDWPRVEVLVVDDASEDSTTEEVAALARRHPNVRLLRHPTNRGVAAARNTIIAEAGGAFVAFFDDDDESVPHRISTQIARIETYEEAFAGGAPVVCHAARRQVSPNGAERIETTMGCASDAPAPAGRAVAERVLTGKPLRGGYGSLATCSQMARLTTYRDIGGFDAAFRRSEDTDLAVRWALAGAHFIGVAEPLVIQTMEITGEKSLEIEWEFASALLRKHRSTFASEADYAFAQEWLNLKFQWLHGRRALFRKELLRLAARRPLATARRMAYALPMAASRASVRRLHQTQPSPLLPEGAA